MSHTYLSCFNQYVVHFHFTLRSFKFLCLHFINTYCKYNRFTITFFFYILHAMNTLIPWSCDRSFNYFFRNYYLNYYRNIRELDRRGTIQHRVITSRGDLVVDLNETKSVGTRRITGRTGDSIGEIWIPGRVVHSAALAPRRTAEQLLCSVHRRPLNHACDCSSLLTFLFFIFCQFPCGPTSWLNQARITYLSLSLSSFVINSYHKSQSLSHVYIAKKL